MAAKYIDWSEDKNKVLLQERDCCFEDVVLAIEAGQVLADEPHPNQTDFAHQRLLIIELDGYACVVPYVEDDEKLFLKTIYRSRVYQKKYLGGE